MDLHSENSFNNQNISYDLANFAETQGNDLGRPNSYKFCYQNYFPTICSSPNNNFNQYYQSNSSPVQIDKTNNSYNSPASLSYINTTYPYYPEYSYSQYSYNDSGYSNYSGYYNLNQTSEIPQTPSYSNASGFTSWTQSSYQCSPNFSSDYNAITNDSVVDDKLLKQSKSNEENKIMEIEFSKLSTR